MKPVGENIRDPRLRSGWSLKLAAECLGISSSALSKIEESITDMNLSRLEQIANVYGVQLAQLWFPDIETTKQPACNLNVAKKKIFELESDVNAFQRKLIFLYEKLREQSGSLQASA